MNGVVAEARGLRGDMIEVPDDLWRMLRRLAEGAKRCLDQHSDRMTSDPEYRAAVEHVTKLLSARPGRLGETVRAVMAGRTLLANLL